MSAEESSPLERTAGTDPENRLRTTLGIVAIALLLILLIYAYTGTRDRSLDVDLAALVFQERIDQLICCTVAHHHAGTDYLLMVTRDRNGEFRRVALRVLQIDANGQANEVNAIGSPFDSLLPAGFAVVEDTIYVPLFSAEQAGVWTIDLSDPEWPEDLGYAETTGGIARQLAAGDNVAAINHTEEIVFLDLSDPASPVPVARMDQEPSSAVRLRIEDDRLYVNEGDADTLRIIDISDPANPEEIGAWVNPDGPGEVPIPFGVANAEEMLDATAIPQRYLDFTVDGDLAFVAASDLGLQVLDVSDPASIEMVGSLEMPDRAIRVAREGDRLYVLGGSAEDVERLSYSIHTVDVSDPASPALLDSITEVPAEPGLQAFAAMDGYVFTGLDENLLVFDVED